MFLLTWLPSCMNTFLQPACYSHNLYQLSRALVKSFCATDYFLGLIKNLTISWDNLVLLTVSAALCVFSNDFILVNQKHSVLVSWTLEGFEGKCWNRRCQRAKFAYNQVWEMWREKNVACFLSLHQLCFGRGNLTATIKAVGVWGCLASFSGGASSGQLWCVG